MQRRLVAPIAFAVLVMLLGMSEVWGQTMRTGANFLNAHVPASSADSFAGVALPGGRTIIHVTGPDADNNTFLGPGLGDPSSGDAGVLKNGERVPVIDWVLVQARITQLDVEEGVGANVRPRCVAELSCVDVAGIVTKAALLFADGTIAEVSNLENTGTADVPVYSLTEEGVLFDGIVDFDPNRQSLYVAVNHRNHLPLLSNTEVGAGDDGVYTYDLTVVQNVFANENLFDQTNLPANATLAAGDANTDNSIAPTDLIAVSGNFGAIDEANILINVDVDMNGVIQPIDLTRYVLPNLRQRPSPLFAF